MQMHIRVGLCMHAVYVCCYTPAHVCCSETSAALLPLLIERELLERQQDHSGPPEPPLFVAFRRWCASLPPAL